MGNESLEHQIRKLRFSVCELEVHEYIDKVLRRSCNKENPRPKIYLITNN